MSYVGSPQNYSQGMQVDEGRFFQPTTVESCFGNGYDRATTQIKQIADEINFCTHAPAACNAGKLSLSPRVTLYGLHQRKAQAFQDLWSKALGYADSHGKQIAGIYLQHNQTDRALEVLEQYVNSNPRDKESVEELARLYLKKADFLNFAKAAAHLRNEYPLSHEYSQATCMNHIMNRIGNNPYLMHKFAKLLARENAQEEAAYVAKKRPDTTQILEGAFRQTYLSR